MKSISDVDREKIVVLLEKDISTEDIKAIFRDEYTTQQIAAIKAWRTMGKFREKRSYSKSRFNDDDRKRVISLVKSGFTTPAITKKFRGRFTRRQIGSVKAWVTMGKY